MPAVEGQPEDDAVDAIRAAGFKTKTKQTFSDSVPKGEVISFESTDVAVGILGQDADCTRFSGAAQGVSVDYINTKQLIDGFSWDAPAAPDSSALNAWSG